jgi:hypothetical protein
MIIPLRVAGLATNNEKIVGSVSQKVDLFCTWFFAEEPRKTKYSLTTILRIALAAALAQLGRSLRAYID